MAAEERQSVAVVAEVPHQLRLALLTLNEGALRMPRARVEGALHTVLAGLSTNGSAAAPDGDPHGLAAVVLARQEVHEDNGLHWDGALAAQGFGSRAVEVVHNRDTRLAVYCAGTASASSVCVAGDFVAPSESETSPKGVIGAVLRMGDFTIGFGSAHLDGNALPRERLAPMPEAVRQARSKAGGDLDAMLILGDINCAMEPTAKALEASDLSRRAAGLLAGEFEHILKTDKNAVFKLPDELAHLLRENLATREGREALMAMDGCPESIPVEDSPSSPLRLVPMLPGSFPTYRLCNLDNRGFDLLRSACDAGNLLVEEGAFVLSPRLEVTPDCIQACYFRDSNKGHAGAIKKRGDMCRLNLGWLDRLYVAAKASPVAQEVRVEAKQGEPVFLLSEVGEAIDHCLTPWLVTVARASK